MLLHLRVTADSHVQVLDDEDDVDDDEVFAMTSTRVSGLSSGPFATEENWVNYRGSFQTENKARYTSFAETKGVCVRL